MPLPLIPLLVGAGGTAAVGWWWSSDSSEDQKPTFAGELWATIQPFVWLLLVVLFVRWAWKKGTIEGRTKNKGST
jgi:hypothetical protein